MNYADHFKNYRHIHIDSHRPPRSEEWRKVETKHLPPSLRVEFIAMAARSGHAIWITPATKGKFGMWVKENE